MGCPTRYTITGAGKDGATDEAAMVAVRAEAIAIAGDDLFGGEFSWYEHEEHIAKAMGHTGVDSVSLHLVDDEGNHVMKDFTVEGNAVCVAIYYCVPNRNGAKFARAKHPLEK